jgi:hypothetical protein
MATSPGKDLSTCNRVYVQGEHIVSLAVSKTHRILYIHTRFLQKYFLEPKDLQLADVSAFLCGNAGIDIWCICHLSGSNICLSRSRFKRSNGACLALSYTSNIHFSESLHLTIPSVNSLTPMVAYINQFL